MCSTGARSFGGHQVKFASRSTVISHCATVLIGPARTFDGEWSGSIPIRTGSIQPQEPRRERVTGEATLPRAPPCPYVELSYAAAQHVLIAMVRKDIEAAHYGSTRVAHCCRIVTRRPWTGSFSASLPGVSGRGRSRPRWMSTATRSVVVVGLDVARPCVFRSL